MKSSLLVTAFLSVSVAGSLALFEINCGKRVITTGESATSLCLRNMTLSTVSLISTSKSQTSAAPVLFTPSTRIVGFSGCFVQRIASEEKKMSYLMCH